MWFVAVVMLNHGAVHAAPLDALRAEDAIHAEVRRMAAWPAESEQRDFRALTCRGDYEMMTAQSAVECVEAEDVVC